MFKNNASMKVISLLAALVLWLYVMGEVDPELRGKVGDIPVNLVNTEELAYKGLAPIYEDQIFVSATISGKRSDVNDAKKNGLVATVDVAGCTMGDNELKISVNLPDGVSLENVSQSTVNIKAENLISAYREVVVEAPPADATAEKVPVVLEYYPMGVYVSGAASSVEKIAKVRGTIDPEKATGESKWTTVKLKPVNNKDKEILNIKLSQETAEVNIQKLPAKVVNLKLTAADNVNLNEIEMPDRIRIAGSNEAIAEISQIEGEVAIDDKGKITIDAELPTNVYIVIGEDNGKIIWN